MYYETDPWGWVGFEDYWQSSPAAYALRLNSTQPILNDLPDTSHSLSSFVGLGLDSHSSAYVSHRVYLIGGFTHIGHLHLSQNDATCGYSAQYKHNGGENGHNIDLLHINAEHANASLYWDKVTMPYELAMVCSVVVEDRYIYVTGGYNVISN